MARACQESKRGVNNPSGIYNIAPFGTQQKAMQGKLSPKRFGKGYGNLKAHTIEPKGDAQSNGFPSKQDMFVKLVSPQGLTNQVFTHFISIPNWTAKKECPVRRDARLTCFTGWHATRTAEDLLTYNFESPFCSGSRLQALKAMLEVRGLRDPAEDFFPRLGRTKGRSFVHEEVSWKSLKHLAWGQTPRLGSLVTGLTRDAFCCQEVVGMWQSGFCHQDLSKRYVLAILSRNDRGAVAVPWLSHVYISL